MMASMWKERLFSFDLNSASAVSQMHLHVICEARCSNVILGDRLHTRTVDSAKCRDHLPLRVLHH